MINKNKFVKFSALAIFASVLVPQGSLAAALTNRSVTLGNSGGAAVTTYAFSFKPSTSGNIGAVKFEICDSPLETATCVNTGASMGESFIANGASLQSQGGLMGFTVANGTPPAPTANAIYLTNPTAQNITAGTTLTAVFQNVRNPTVSNQQFYTRVTTYSNSNATVEVDYGAEAVSTSQAITVSGTMPESLVFCVGTSGTNCTNITGSAVSLGVFSPVATSTGTSVMSASTNAAFGYTITLTGTTMMSGINTIPAMGTQSLNSSACSISCTSTMGIGQFGTNVRANTSPSVGMDVTGAGVATGSGGYNTVNAFRFFSGDTVAAVNGATKSNLFTNSYIVNVGGDQTAGVYTATMTYICTATF